LESGPREPVLQLRFAGLVGKVAYKQFFQGSSLWPDSTAGVRMGGHTTNPSRLPGRF
jgi:hypothetical protein